MNHKLRRNRVWQILYPISVYVVFFNLIFSVLQLLFAKATSSLLLMGVSALLVIPILLNIYRKLPIVKAEKNFEWKTIGWEVLAVFGIVVVGDLLNYLLSHTALVKVSEGFSRSNEVLTDGGILVKIIVLCVLVPFLEELLYRGIVCGQLKLWYSSWVAVLISAFLFGAMHFNIVQFLYGLLVGSLLSILYTKTSKLWLCIVAHGLSNFSVIILAYVGIS